MKNRLELFAGPWIGEHSLPNEIAPEPPFLVENFRTENPRNLGQGRLPGLDNSPREIIGIDDRNASRLKQPRANRFPHADPAG